MLLCFESGAGVDNAHLSRVGWSSLVRVQCNLYRKVGRQSLSCKATSKDPALHFLLEASVISVSSTRFSGDPCPLCLRGPWPFYNDPREGQACSCLEKPGSKPSATSLISGFAQVPLDAPLHWLQGNCDLYLTCIPQAPMHLLAGVCLWGARHEKYCARPLLSQIHVQIASRRVESHICVELQEFSRHRRSRPGQSSLQLSATKAQTMLEPSSCMPENGDLGPSAYACRSAGPCLRGKACKL